MLLELPLNRLRRYVRIRSRTWATSLKLRVATRALGINRGDLKLFRRLYIWRDATELNPISAFTLPALLCVGKLDFGL